MIKLVAKLLVCALPLVALLGCGTKVTRIHTNSTVDLSGRWNDADSRLVAEAMISDCLNQRWLFKWESQSKKPTVIVGKITNQSHEHLTTDLFSKDIERSLLNSGRVSFVASKAERQQLRDEKADMQSNSSVQTRVSEGEESGADLMLIGTINSIVDQEGSESVVVYQVNMELIDIESNAKVWIGEKKIKKFVERSSTKF